MTEDKQESAFKALEERVKNPEGILSICMIKECHKLKIEIDPEEFYWMSRDEKPELYDRAVEAFGNLNQPYGALSDSYCPTHFNETIDNI